MVETESADELAPTLHKITIRTINSQLRDTFGPKSPQLEVGASVATQIAAHDAIVAYQRLRFMAAGKSAINAKPMRFPVALYKGQKP